MEFGQLDVRIPCCARDGIVLFYVMWGDSVIQHPQIQFPEVAIVSQKDKSIRKQPTLSKTERPTDLCFMSKCGDNIVIQIKQTLRHGVYRYRQPRGFTRTRARPCKV